MTLIINIPPELESRLQHEASLTGVALDEYARMLLEKTLAPVKSGPPDIAKGDAWSVLESMKGSVEGPPDWSSELDHYLYRTPKRDESTR
jgi:hypothetical protein